MKIVTHSKKKECLPVFDYIFIVFFVRKQIHKKQNIYQFYNRPHNNNVY